MKNKSQSGSGHLVIIIVLVLALLSALGYILYQNLSQANKKVATIEKTESAQTNTVVQPETQLEQGNFSKEPNDVYYGTSQVEGYATTESRPDCSDVCYCGENGELCDTVSYVLFHVTKSNNESLSEYLSNLNGNSFGGTNSVGVGCLADGVISYSNVSDANGWQSHTISQPDTAKIIASTEQNPIIIELTRLKYTSGMGAPSCYSHFDTFSVVE